MVTRPAPSPASDRPRLTLVPSDAYTLTLPARLSRRWVADLTLPPPGRTIVVHLEETRLIEPGATRALAWRLVGRPVTWVGQLPDPFDDALTSLHHALSQHPAVSA